MNPAGTLGGDARLDLLTSRAFERVARQWARSAIVRAPSAKRERASESSCRFLPHQTRKPCERLWESLMLDVLLRCANFKSASIFTLRGIGWECAWNYKKKIRRDKEKKKKASSYKVSSKLKLLELERGCDVWFKMLPIPHKKVLHGWTL